MADPCSLNLDILSKHMNLSVENMEVEQLTHNP